MEGQVLWHCFRASCSGVKGTNTSVPHSPETRTIRKEAVRFEGKTEPLTDEEVAWIEQNWGITDPPYWYHTDDFGGRIAMSIRSPKYEHRGWVLRDIEGKSGTKALTFLAEGVSQSWYKTDPTAPTVVVEDIPSAVRASRYVNSIALLGTGVGMSKAEEIAQHATRPIVIALDPDALQKAFKIAAEYHLLLNAPRVMLLDKDIKDMEEDYLQDLIRTVT